MTSIAVGIGLTLLGLVTPAALAWTLIWSLSIGGLLAGTHLMAAFRGLPPIGVFGPRAGMPAMVFWYVKPLLSTLVVGTATAADVDSRGITDTIALNWAGDIQVRGRRASLSRARTEYGAGLGRRPTTHGPTR